MFIIDWIKANPTTFAIALLSVLTFIARFAKPGTRLAAFFAAMPSIDIVKLVCIVLNIPLPGGFSPAPAVIPVTPEADAKMPEPKPAKAPTPPAGAATLALFIGLVTFAVCLFGCPKCPTTPPPPAPQASAIVLRVDDAVSTTEASMLSHPKLTEKVAAARLHLLKIKSGEASFWCGAKSLYDELVALEGEVVAAGLPIPPQLTEALQLVQWAVDRVGCTCPAGGA